MRTKACHQEEAFDRYTVNYSTRRKSLYRSQEVFPWRFHARENLSTPRQRGKEEIEWTHCACQHCTKEDLSIEHGSLQVFESKRRIQSSFGIPHAESPILFVEPSSRNAATPSRDPLASTMTMYTLALRPRNQTRTAIEGHVCRSPDRMQG